MHLRLGFRTLIAICVTLAILLGVVAFVQYRWSNRVAAADIQREREHLNVSASLFVTRFSRNIADAVGFVQNDAQTAWSTGTPLPAFPKLLDGLYLLDTSGSQPRVKRAYASGSFAAASIPEWMKQVECTSLISQQPLAIISPVFDSIREEQAPGGDRRILRTSRGSLCFVALLNENFIKGTLIPTLLQETFGESSMNDYDFAIVSRSRDGERIYGPRVTPDLRRTFFTVQLRNLLPAPKRPPSSSGKEISIFQRYEIGTHSRAPRLPPQLGDGIWELQIARHGMSLPAAFRGERRRDLLFGLAAELLLGAAIVLLLIGAHRMQQVAEQRMQFVAAISHELRTPVSSISMLSRNQADGLVSGADKVAQYGELIHQQSRRLSEMIEQTLQYAGIHSHLGTRNRTPVDVEAVIATALDGRKEELAREQFHVELIVPKKLPAVQGDANLLRIAIDNLLSNAIKYAKSGRWIGIQAEHSVKEHAILIHVSDRGPGVEDSDQERLFEPFYRGKAAVATGASGSGIGLSLVRSAAEAHGGSITMVSTPGQGSTFTLRIPA
ncbi:sensor histidine kinase [Terriglobus albidus]|uniref:sensor histidine kinase n=1 Tax=Terriglobus albidus TaxID=1592106 RepID=UPI0021DFC0EE|nr:HAMP domain-containing sensor histidine kinase [Terriglobus albidus]